MSLDKFVFRVVTRGIDGEIKTKEYVRIDSIEKMHTQVGIDDCSTDLNLRGLPVFSGLIGPIPDGKGFVRYESPEVFETLTKEWTNTKVPRRRRRTAKPEGLIAPPPSAVEETI